MTKEDYEFYSISRDHNGGYLIERCTLTGHISTHGPYYTEEKTLAAMEALKLMNKTSNKTKIFNKILDGVYNDTKRDAVVPRTGIFEDILKSRKPRRGDKEIRKALFELSTRPFGSTR